MGRSIDLYSYDYEKLVNKTIEICKTDHRELVEEILLNCGNKISDRYVILNQEMWEGYSCYYNVADVLEKAFKVDDVFGEVFCSFKDNGTDRKELISSVDTWDICEKLSIEYTEEE